MKDKFLFIFRLSAGAGIVFVLFHTVPYEQLKQQLADADLRFLVFAFAEFFSLYIISTFRWQSVLAASGINISYWQTFYLLICGLFFNLFCPSIVASDVFRASMISVRDKHKGTKTASTVLLDRISGFAGLFLVSLAAVGMAPEVVAEPEVLLSIIALFVLLLLVCGFIFSRRFAKSCIFFVSFSKKLEQIFTDLSEELRLFRRDPLLFVRMVGLSVIVHMGVVISFYLSSLAFGTRVSLMYFAVVVPVILVMSVLPVSIAGLGTREIGALFFLTRIGVSQSAAIGISLMNFVFIVISGLTGGVMYAVYSKNWLVKRRNV